MSDDQISVAARLNAERLMSGRKITDDEMRVIMAGLLLAVDRLTNALVSMEGRLWSETRLREIVGAEVERHCRANRALCPGGEARGATWLGKLIRSVFGFKAA